jgi:SAM-dependent methyltransferase
MIAQMDKKMKASGAENVKIVHGSLVSEEFTELDEFKGKVDFITINHVIHHLDTDYKTNPNFRKAISNLYTLLRPGGKICINHILPEHILSMWYFNIIAAAGEKHSIRFQEKGIVEQAYAEAGLKEYREIKCTDTYIGLNHYNLVAPLEESFRKTDSFYVDTQEHLEAYLAELRAKLESGTIVQFLQEMEKKRMENGLSSFFIAIK